jgi:hypothetical protein
MRSLPFLFMFLFIFGTATSLCDAQENPPGYQQTTDQKIASLQDEVTRLRTSSNAAASGSGLVFILFGGFCALWAQNTNRSPWLWFFLGLFFTAFALIAVLIKNSDAKKFKNPRLFSEGRKIGTP